MSKCLWSMVILPALLGLLTEPVSAASMKASPIRMEMLILIPGHHQLAVYQQVAMTRVGDSRMPLGIIPGAQSLTGLGVRIEARKANEILIKATQSRFALRYNVPWNGSSMSVPLPNYTGVGELLVLTPRSLSLPAVLNPSLVAVGHGKIPGIPASPIFYEYATSNVSAGQSLPLVVESRDAGNTAPLTTETGDHPMWAVVFQILMALVSLSAMALAINWRVASTKPRYRKVDRYLEELAMVVAAYGRGELDDETYECDRHELQNLVLASWDDWRG